MFVLQQSFGGGRAVGGGVSRKSGSMASFSGGSDMVYLEVKQKPSGSSSSSGQQHHSLWKLRRKQ